MESTIFTPASGGKFTVERIGETELRVNGNIEIGKKEKMVLFINATVWWEIGGPNEGILRIKDGYHVNVAGSPGVILREMINPIIEAASEFLALENQVTTF